MDNPLNELKLDGKLNFSPQNRTHVDELKGLLIVFVVVGHVAWAWDAINTVIFWFHMPLFFVLSGMLYHPRKSIKLYAMHRIKRLLPPCVAWYILNTLLFSQFRFKIGTWLLFLWGGRLLEGVYWFSTCLVLSSIFFAFIEKYLPKYLVWLTLLIFLLFSAAESRIYQQISLPHAASARWMYSVPWNTDVAILGVVYIGLGFYSRYALMKLIDENSVHIRRSFGLIAVLVYLVAVLGLLTRKFNFKIDMKNVIYSNPFFDVLMPMCGLLILVVLMFFLSRCSLLKRMLAYLGKASMVIMFAHLSLLHYMQSIFGTSTLSMIWIVIVDILIALCLFSLLQKNKFTRSIFLSGFK